MDSLYTAVATAVGGRNGRVQTDDQTLDHPVSMPKGLGGPGGEGTNPEQLFAAGYAACFGGALALMARNQKVDTTGPAEVTAHVSIGRVDGGLKLAVTLEGHLPGVSTEQTQALMEAAHQVCPYSKATRGNIDVTLAVR